MGSADSFTKNGPTGTHGGTVVGTLWGTANQARAARSLRIRRLKASSHQVWSAENPIYAPASSADLDLAAVFQALSDGRDLRIRNMQSLQRLRVSRNFESLG